MNLINALIIYTAGVVTGAVVVLVCFLIFLHHINKAFEEDRKNPWRLEK